MEDLLEEALVPDGEQLYELPPNWEWVRLGNLITLLSGRDIPSSKCNNGGIGIPYIMGASNFRNNDLVIERWIEEPTVVGFKGDILLSVKGTVGKMLIQSHEKLHLSRQIMGIRTNYKLNNRYLMYFLKTYISVLKENAKGLIPGISREDILDIKLPLPPLIEQNRIVENIERLLNKIEEAKQLIEEAKETFELRRAATLDKAFRGELTKEFRESQRNKTNIELENNIVNKFKSQLDSKIKGNLYVLPEGWKWVEVNDLIENMTYGTSSKTNDDVSGTPVIRMGNIQAGKITKVNYKYLPTDHPDVLKFDVQTNDILFNRTNSYELVGKSAIITEDFDGRYSFASYLIRLRLIEKAILAPYIVQFINSHIGREMLLSMVTQQVGQANINSQKLASLMIPLPTIEEIKEINKWLEKLDDRERNAIEVLEIDSTVNNLKQSILSKAFKGKLGTTDPNDEPAIELLKSILQEKS